MRRPKNTAIFEQYGRVVWSKRHSILLSYGRLGMVIARTRVGFKMGRGACHGNWSSNSKVSLCRRSMIVCNPCESCLGASENESTQKRKYVNPVWVSYDSARVLRQDAERWRHEREARRLAEEGEEELHDSGLLPWRRGRRCRRW